MNGGFPDYIVTIENEAECRGCGQPILWCRTQKGKFSPVDYEVDDGGEYVYLSNHFDTCPEADSFRKGAKR